MNDRLDDLDTIRYTKPTHQVTNQPPPLTDALPAEGRQGTAAALVPAVGQQADIARRERRARST